MVLIPQLCLSPVACCCVRLLLHIGCWELGARNTDTCTTPNYSILSYPVLFYPVGLVSGAFFFLVAPLSRSICRRGDTASTFSSRHILSLLLGCVKVRYACTSLHGGRASQRFSCLVCATFVDKCALNINIMSFFAPKACRRLSWWSGK